MLNLHDISSFKRKSDLFFILGPCVVESRDITLQVADVLATLKNDYNFDIIFKASFKKANRTSLDSFTGLPLDEALRILEEVKSTYDFNILSDVHESTNIDEIVDVVDILQTPAFLVRQTEFLRKVASYGKTLNIKKGQFLSPQEMLQVVNKIESFGNMNFMICERGSSFGYNYLINDFRAMQQLLDCPYPFVFDATHSVQRPGAQGTSSGGDAQYAPGLAKAAAAIGVDGIFMETHPSPATALSDGPNMIPLHDMRMLLPRLMDIKKLVSH